MKKYGLAEGGGAYMRYQFIAEDEYGEYYRADEVHAAIAELEARHGADKESMREGWAHAREAYEEIDRGQKGAIAELVAMLRGVAAREECDGGSFCGECFASNGVHDADCQLAALRAKYKDVK